MLFRSILSLGFPADRRRKRRRIQISARAIRTNRAGPETQVVLIDVVFAARIFLNFFVGFPEHPRSRIVERPRVKLRVLDQSFDVNMIGIRPRPSFDDVQRVAVRVCVFVDPDFLVFEADRVDYQGIALPVPKLFTKERRIGIAGMFARRIDGDEPVVAVPVRSEERRVGKECRL